MSKLSSGKLGDSKELESLGIKSPFEESWLTTVASSRDTGDRGLTRRVFLSTAAGTLISPVLASSHLHDDSIWLGMAGRRFVIRRDDVEVFSLDPELFAG